MEVIAVFDIGKTNKKFLLFDRELKLVHQEEIVFNTIPDDDGFECDDIESLEAWVKECVASVDKQKYNIKAMNFSTYGATLVFLDAHGRRLTPVYNYLKPLPDNVTTGFYEKYGGVEEFSRKTASPALGMLNSGLQVLWLKRKKPEIFRKVKHIFHFPQYLSYIYTHEITSEFTSIGCHTAMWDFDKHRYHPWLSDEEVKLPEPVSNATMFEAEVNGTLLKTGIGIHDSSASLVPYLMGTRDQFMLISTGTWCIFMNPFNYEPLTNEQLRKDSLCYMSIQQQQVKSSRLFLGHMHDVNVERISKYFGTSRDHYKTIKTSENKISKLIADRERHFFKNGIPEDYTDINADLKRFLTFNDAYHRLMADLVDLSMESLSLVIPENDQSKIVYISGGFARNELFTKLLASRLPDKKVFISEIDNTTALGAAMVVYESAFGKKVPEIDIGLKRV